MCFDKQRKKCSMIKIATPISHLFDDPESAREILKYSDCLECRDRNYETNFPGQELFHCSIQPIHELRDEDFRYLEKVSELKKDLRLISFHAASSCSRPTLEGAIFKPGGVRYTREEMLENARKNIAVIKKIFGTTIGIAIENNNYYPTEAYKFVTDANFIKEVVCDNEILFLYDIAHAKITAHNAALDYEVYKSGLPLKQIVQIHVCRHSFAEKSNARDDHEIPDGEVWREVEDILSNSKLIEYVTVEYYGKVDKLVESLKRAKEIINALSEATI